MEANILKTVEKRSLLPRMIYLSIHTSSLSVKKSVEANGSSLDPKFSLELKSLLERYANILEFPFHDAVELVLGVSSGRKPLEVWSFDFTVLFCCNAYLYFFIFFILPLAIGRLGNGNRYQRVWVWLWWFFWRPVIYFLTFRYSIKVHASVVVLFETETTSHEVLCRPWHVTLSNFSYYTFFSLLWNRLWNICILLFQNLETLTCARFAR